MISINGVLCGYSPYPGVVASQGRETSCDGNLS